MALTSVDAVYTLSTVDFEWDAVNAKHLRRHRITQAEAEEAILIDSVEMGIQRHPTEDRVLSTGRTTKGRLLTIIYATRGDRIRVVTGLPCDPAAAAHLLRGKIACRKRLGRLRFRASATPTRKPLGGRVAPVSVPPRN
jgi:uncharacterized DUF497 family protein